MVENERLHSSHFSQLKQMELYTNGSAHINQHHNLVAPLDTVAHPHPIAVSKLNAQVFSSCN